MIEPLHLYPDVKKAWQEREAQGFRAMTCNNWLCPFNNDGYCVSREAGDECIWDEDFKKYLEVVYDESLPDDMRESHRTVMIAKWGRLIEYAERKEE